MGSVADLLPVYLGIAVASLALTALNQAWGRFLTGLSVGILLYLCFDVMHKAMELTGVRDILSWPILLGSLFVSFSGLAAIEERRRQTNTSDTTPLFLPSDRLRHGPG